MDDGFCGTNNSGSVQVPLGVGDSRVVPSLTFTTPLLIRGIAPSFIRRAGVGKGDSDWGGGLRGPPSLLLLPMTVPRQLDQGAFRGGEGGSFG